MMIISQTVKTDLHLTTLGLVSMDELRLFVSQALMTLLCPPPIMIRNSEFRNFKFFLYSLMNNHKLVP